MEFDIEILEALGGGSLVTFARFDFEALRRIGIKGISPLIKLTRRVMFLLGSTRTFFGIRLLTSGTRRALLRSSLLPLGLKTTLFGLAAMLFCLSAMLLAPLPIGEKHDSDDHGNRNDDDKNHQTSAQTQSPLRLHLPG